MVYTSAALTDIHTSTHLGLARLMQHCAVLSSAELNLEMEGFSYPSILLQIDHLIGAEEYWISVLQGRWDTDGSMPEIKTLASLEDYRVRMQNFTAEYLRGIDDVALNSEAELGVWPDGKLRPLVPALVVMRVLTHSFQHRGQVIAMCRLLGHPAPPTDFPVMRTIA